MTDLTTLAAFKAYAGVENDNSDPLIERLVTAYSEAVRQYTNRDFTLGSYSRTFDGRNHTRQLLPQYPIRSVSAVQVGTSVVPARASFGLPGFAFDETSVILSGHRFERGEANILISWTAGYDTVPADIEEAVLKWIAVSYANRGDKAGWSSMTLAAQTVSLITKSMPDTVRGILDQRARKVPL